MAKTTVLLQKQIVTARKKCIAKFLYYFKKGFYDPLYLEWERMYKANAHDSFRVELGKVKFETLLKKKDYKTIASITARIESKTNLLFSFEKMAFRDAVKSTSGAKLFSIGLYDYLYGKDKTEIRFNNFVDVVQQLPRKQTRVLTWPIVTVFGFIGNPKEHIFLKPRVTQRAAENYKFEFNYVSQPNYATYESMLDFAQLIKYDLRHLAPRDYIDLQSFIWVLGSDEYPD